MYVELHSLGHIGSELHCCVSVSSPGQGRPAGTDDGEGLVHVLLRSLDGGLAPLILHVPEQGPQAPQSDQLPCAWERQDIFKLVR